jgi:hypothetical protein
VLVHPDGCGAGAGLAMVDATRAARTAKTMVKRMIEYFKEYAVGERRACGATQAGMARWIYTSQADTPRALMRLQSFEEL